MIGDLNKILQHSAKQNGTTIYIPLQDFLNDAGKIFSLLGAESLKNSAFLRIDAMLGAMNRLLSTYW